MKRYLKDYYGQIVGSIEDLPNGDKLARDRYGRNLGKYDSKGDLTKDFYGRIVSRGDSTSNLVWEAENARRASMQGGSDGGSAK